MERVAKIFRSFQDADEAETAYYRALTPPERIDILLELVRRGQSRDETECRLERVYRIVELSRG
jgi:hypothetical protein